MEPRFLENFHHQGESLYTSGAGSMAPRNIRFLMTETDLVTEISATLFDMGGASASSLAMPSLSLDLLLKTSQHLRIFHRMSRRVTRQKK